MFTSVCVVPLMQLVTVVSRLSRLCMKIYTVFRTLLYDKMFVNFRCRMYCIYKHTMRIAKAARSRMDSSTPSERAYVSACKVDRHTLPMIVEENQSDAPPYRFCHLSNESGPVRKVIRPFFDCGNSTRFRS